MDNTINIDKEILLYSIGANSNGFIEIIENEELIRVGKDNYFNTDEYLIHWLGNGRRAMKKQIVKRIRWC